MDPPRFEPDMPARGTPVAASAVVAMNPVALDEASARLPVVVLSGGVTALGVMRAFGRRGITTYVHPDTPEYIRHSRWYRPLPTGKHTQYGGPHSAVSLRDALERSGIEQAFLCACSDDWNRAVAELAGLSGDRFLSVVPTPAALDQLQDKGHLAALLQRVGVPMPLTRLVRGEDDVADLPQSSETFYFLKPTDSQRFLAQFGTKGMRVPTPADARRRLREVVAAGLSVVLQEYIPGSSAEHYFIDGYISRSGEAMALFARRRLRIYPPDFGNSTAMISVPLAHVEQAVDSVRRVLGAVDYHGIFSAEFKRDARDGLFKLLEVNTRPWWFVDFAVRCGVDVCRMAYEDAQGLPVTPPSDYRIGATCVFPYYDFFAVQPMLDDGRITWMRWMREIAPALQPVGCWDDPIPGVVAFTRVIKSAIQNRLHRPTLAAR
jgi:predicted ATP-grasp superfamily ATP-dependent carboligase